MRIVIALGGNALLRKDDNLSAALQLKNIQIAAEAIVKLAAEHELVITHGNGPQIGLLALQTAAYSQSKTTAFPLDVLGAETEGMIGYLLQQEIANLLPPTRKVAALLTRVAVSETDPAFHHPTKPIGPYYEESEWSALKAQEPSWSFTKVDKQYRRVVASPKPLHLLEIEPLLWLLEKNAIVIAAGGGGIPVVKDESSQKYRGIEAVIDKDLCSALLAEAIGAECFIIATDVPAVYQHYQQPNQEEIRNISAETLSKMNFPAGSMGPKVEAVCQFVTATKKSAIIGSLEKMDSLIRGSSGTWVIP